MTRIFRDLIEYKELLKNLVYQNLKARYRNSILGLFWTLLHPLLTLLVLWVVFSRISRFGQQNYAMFLFAGMVPWFFFAQVINQSLNSVISQRSLINKIYLPKIIFPISIALSNVINFLFFLLTYIVICAFTDIGLKTSLLLLPIPMIMLFIMALGLGILLSALNIFFRDFTHLTGIVLQVTFYMSPILYHIDIMGKYKSLFMCNPFYYIVANFRGVMYYGALPGAFEVLTGFAISISFLLLGVFVFMRSERKFIYYV